MKLGKLPPKIDRRTIDLAPLLKLEELPAPPPARDWSAPLLSAFPMFANDRYGCCAYASAAHLIRVFTGQHGPPAAISDQDVLDAYAKGTGFNPDDPSTDNGATMLDVLKQWRTDGIAGHRIGGFAKINHIDSAEMSTAVNLFGGVYIGACLPITAQSSGRWQGPSDTNGRTDKPNSWGGHAMALPMYDRSGVGFLTWARVQLADWLWLVDYIDEAYAVFSEDWVSGAMPAPNGFDVDKLRAYLAGL